LIVGKENLISSQNLLTEIELKNVFLEEPIDNDQERRETQYLGTVKDLDTLK